jgi:hypothetical protein
MTSKKSQHFPQPWHLPRKHWTAHWFCFFLHDQLVESLKSAEKAGLFQRFHIDLHDPSHGREVRLRDAPEALDWLRANGYEAEVFALYHNHIVAALMSDFLHFVHEALQCSRKSKLTVAYALLRKPLKENLFYLEWLLARPADFLRRFDNEDGNRFKLGEESSREEQIEIIREATAKTACGEWIDPDFLYDLRFNKGCPYGLEATLQKANHLFTSFRLIKTERANFNFVFSDAAAHKSQWDTLYMLLPLLLFHAVSVIEALIGRIGKREYPDVIPLRTVAGLFLWNKSQAGAPEQARDIERSIRSVLDSIQLPCAHCAAEIVFNQANIKRFYEAGDVRCGGCRRTFNVDDELRKTVDAHRPRKPGAPGPRLTE